MRANAVELAAFFRSHKSVGAADMVARLAEVRTATEFETWFVPESTKNRSVTSPSK